ncbi:MAG TPA: hypothetical protein VGK88_09805, partial [bacterium]
MRSATFSIPASRARASRVPAAALVAAALAAIVVWWTRPPAAPITAGQILALMPAGSTLHSLARVNLDGAPPLEAAVVIAVPPFPGARRAGYTDVITRYNRWTHRIDVVYRETLSGGVPVSVDAGRLLGDRDAVLFQAVSDTGRWSYRVVGLVGGTARVLVNAESSDRVTIADPRLVDRGRGRALVWNGSGFSETAMVPPAAVPPTLTWRFRFRSGAVVSRTDHVSLAPRQILRVQPVGGGTTPIVIADPRFDIVENGFRARQEGVYTVRVLASSTPTENAYVLTVVV